MEHGPLTASLAMGLSEVISAAVHNSRVRRLIPDNEAGGGLVVNGTARSVGDQEGRMSPTGSDVRDQYLRVTTDVGFEAFWPVAVLMNEVHQGLFVVDTWAET